MGSGDRAYAPGGTDRGDGLFQARTALAGLVVWGAVCFGAAWAGSALTRPALAVWYRGLPKPWWTPPSWVFGPVWTALFLLMAVAAWLVWLRGGWRGQRLALALFLLQLALNVGWSGCFFGLRAPGLALVEIVLLWLAIYATTVAFFLVRPAAGKLMLPYLAWTAFAGCLNLAIWLG